jgi:isocitrate dehydrogenase
MSASSSDAATSVEVPPPPTSSYRHKPLPGAQGSIIYTETDEAPALATYSLYPVVGKLAGLAGVDVVPCDISLAGRVLSLFPEKLKPSQRVPDNLSYLGELAKLPTANIIKLPNISAPLNQLEDCISELRAKGYDVPMYPREPETEEDKVIQDKYKTVMGSAVNPVLREGNSDRRVAPPVKAYAQKNPHRMVSCCH